MSIMTLVFLVGGLGLLVLGGEWLVRGASRLAAISGVPPLIIGLTVVSFGTSAPELAVSTQAVLGGQGDIALGNVVGSNIFNILFILGISALIGPLAVQRQLIRVDVPLMIGASLALLLISLDGSISPIDGIFLATSLFAYIGWQIIQSRRQKTAHTAAEGGSAQAPRDIRNIFFNLVLIGAGLGLLVLGSRWLVDSASTIARFFGLSELIIGLTIVAVGTSLPEVAASVIAALRGERDIAVGNVIGSNLFNILGILGISSWFAPEGILVPAAALAFDIPVMVAVALACLPIFLTGFRVERWEGGLFLSYYIAYTAFLILTASNHQALPVFSSAMATVVLPVTAVGLIILGIRAALQGNGWPQMPMKR
ncbi:MAG: calcium/sodium antiporter [Oscillochloris sp.]|nr:calcium/sodium antiporter [Oscillochloris sp.]